MVYKRYFREDKMKKIDRSRRGKVKPTEKVLNAKQFNRTEVLQDLHDMLSEMKEKICKGRIRDKQARDIQIRSLKAYAYSASVFSNILDSVENEVVISRLDVIEATLGGAKVDKRKVAE
jgi:hypothetical protein